jgi:hypothetical protein
MKSQHGGGPVVTRFSLAQEFKELSKKLHQAVEADTVNLIDKP